MPLFVDVRRFGVYSCDFVADEFSCFRVFAALSIAVIVLFSFHRLCPLGRPRLPPACDPLGLHYGGYGVGASYEDKSRKMKDKRVNKMGDRDLLERTFNFAVRVIRFLKTIPYSKENEVIRYQLAQCAPSVGANYEESQASSSKEDSPR